MQPNVLRQPQALLQGGRATDDAGAAGSMSERYDTAVARSQAAQQEDEAIALAAVLGSEQARAFIWNLVGMCRFTGASFAGENTHMTAFNEGRRDIGARVFGPILEKHPEMFTLMQREHVARQARYHVIPDETDEQGEDE